MSDAFIVQDLPVRPYVAVCGVVTEETFPEIADRFGEVFDWLAQRGLEPASTPFFRYRAIGADGSFTVEAAVLVDAPQQGSGEVLADSLPAGRYLTTTHTGHPAALLDLADDLLGWAREEGLHPAVDADAAGESWGARLEFYLTGPAEHPDPADWQERLEILLA